MGLYIPPDNHIRGITHSAVMGDAVYKFDGSDVAIVIRNLPNGFVPVAWAIIGMGEIWLPTETIAARLECLHRLALPKAEDWHCCRWAEGELDIKDVTSRTEFSWEAFEEEAAVGMRNRIWVDVDCRLAVTIVEGYITPPQSHRREQPSNLSLRSHLRLYGLRRTYSKAQIRISDWCWRTDRWIAGIWLWNFSILPEIHARYLLTRYQYGAPWNLLYDFSPEHSFKVKAVSIAVNTAPS